MGMVVASVVSHSSYAESTPPAAEGATISLETLEAGTIEGPLSRIESGVVHIGDRAIALDSVKTIVPLPTRNAPSDPPAIGQVGDDEASCVCYLSDGGWVAGKLVDGGNRSVQIDMGAGKPVTIPFNSLAAIRFAQSADSVSEAELKVRLAKREPARDLLIVPKGQMPVVLPGALEALGPDGWEFRLPSRIQKAGLDRAYAVVFGSALAAPATRKAWVTTARGDRFSADIANSNGLVVTLSSALGELKMNWSALARIDIRSNRVTWLGDMKFKSQSVKSALGVEWTPRSNLNVTGGPIRLAGKTYARGLGVHGSTSLTYALDGKQSQLRATIGIDDMIGRRGSVIFRVIGDGRELFKSDTLRGGDKPVEISVDISGVKLLELSTDAADGLDLGDHADWADVRLIRSADGGVS